MVHLGSLAHGGAATNSRAAGYTSLISEMRSNIRGGAHRPFKLLALGLVGVLRSLPAGDRDPTCAAHGSSPATALLSPRDSSIGPAAWPGGTGGLPPLTEGVPPLPPRKPAAAEAVPPAAGSPLPTVAPRLERDMALASATATSVIPGPRPARPDPRPARRRIQSDRSLAGLLWSTSADADSTPRLQPPVQTHLAFYARHPLLPPSERLGFC